MSQEFQKKMFEPFVQEDTDITSTIQGTGLGLSITKSLVDLLGGTITIESSLNHGTTVTLHFKIELAEIPDTANKQTNYPDMPDEMLKGKRVLLVEDHPLNTEIASRLLTKKGMIVTRAENGEIALNRFHNSAPYFFDIILMDIRMPVMDGLTATREIRSLDRTDAKAVPIIAMTANAYPEDIRQTKDAGMNAHLAKPIEPATLYQSMIELLQ
jgi:CheY-like chemotaxis protein